MRPRGQPYNPYRIFYGAYVPEALVAYQGVSAGAKLCFARLCRYAGDRGHCWPSQELLALELGVCPRQVRRYLKELEREGFIHVTRVGLQRANDYTFRWHPIFDGTERPYASAPDRTLRSAPDRTRLTTPSRRESNEQSTTPSPSPSLAAREGQRSMVTRHEKDRSLAIEIAERYTGGTRGETG